MEARDIADCPKLHCDRIRLKLPMLLPNCCLESNSASTCRPPLRITRAVNQLPRNLLERLASSMVKPIGPSTLPRTEKLLWGSVSSQPGQLRSPATWIPARANLTTCGAGGPSSCLQKWESGVMT